MADHNRESVRYDTIYAENVDVIPSAPTNLSSHSQEINEPSHPHSSSASTPTSANASRTGYALEPVIESRTLELTEPALRQSPTPPSPPPPITITREGIRAQTRSQPNRPNSNNQRQQQQSKMKHKSSGFFSSFSLSLSHSRDVHDRNTRKKPSPRQASEGRSQQPDNRPTNRSPRNSRSGSSDPSDLEAGGGKNGRKNDPNTKSFRKIMSDAYLKPLKETARSRFHDWSREELIELLIQAPFHYEIRNEFHIITTTLRDVAEELWRDHELPPRPTLPTDVEFELYDIMARKIQDVWINYMIYKRDEIKLHKEMDYTHQMQQLRASVDFTGDEALVSSLGHELSRTHEEVIADEDIEIGEVLSKDEIEAIEQLFEEQEQEERIMEQQLAQGIEPGISLRDIITTARSPAARSPVNYDASAVGTAGVKRSPRKSPADGIAPEAARPPSSATVLSAAGTLTPHTRPPRNDRINVFDIRWEAPNITIAQHYSNYVQPRKHRKKGLMYDFKKTTTGRYCCLDGLGEQFDLWEEGQVSEFAQYGSGVTNYFKFMKWAAWLFVILTIVSLPMIVLNYVANPGNNRNSGLKELAKTTLGNLALTSANESFSIPIPGCDPSILLETTCRIGGSDLALFYSILDIIISVTVLMAFLWLNYFQHYEEVELGQTLVKPSMYSIAVSQLPKDITERELATHFLKLLKAPDATAIANVSFAYNNRLEIDLCFQRGELTRKKVKAVHEYRRFCTITRLSPNYNQTKEKILITEKERMLKKLKQINDELEKKEKALEILATAGREEDDYNSSPTRGRGRSGGSSGKGSLKRHAVKNNEVILAFVTFDKAKDRDYILSLYRDITFWKYFCSPGGLRLEKNQQWIHVHEAPDPSVIIWENLMFSRSHRLKRSIVTTFLSLLLIIFSLIMIFAAKYLQEQASNNGGDKTTICPSGFASWSDETKVAYIEKYPDSIHCYCDELSTFQQADTSHCQHYLSQNVEAQVLIYFASFMVLLVNYLMEKILKTLSKYEKHHTSDGLGNSIFLRLFVLKYINSAGIFFINNNNTILKTLFGIELNASPEFTANWYNSVGTTIILVQLGDVINCHADTIYKFYSYHQKKFTAILHPEQSLTQDDLNKLMIGPEFDLAYNYAELLTTLFVSLTFATGIPLLYPIAAANFLIFYFTEKYFFIHMYKIPPHFNRTVGKRATLLIPFALGIHIGMSIWMLSNHKLFDDNTNFTDDDYYDAGYATGNYTDSSNVTTTFTLEQYYYAQDSLATQHDIANYTRKRIVERETLPLLICFAAVLLIWFGLLGSRYLKLLWNRFFHFCCKCMTGSKDDDARNEPTLDTRLQPKKRQDTRRGGGGGAGRGKGGSARGVVNTSVRGSDLEAGLFWSNTTIRTAEPTRYQVTYTRAIQRNLIKGLATYNILQNPRYKEAFGITWKFAVDHSRVRSVRGLKIKALNLESDDHIEDMETSGRSSLRRGPSTKPTTTGRTGMTLRSEHKTTRDGDDSKTAEDRLRPGVGKNKSFYSSFYEIKAPTPTATTAAKAKGEVFVTSPAPSIASPSTHSSEIDPRPRRNTSSDYYYNQNVKQQSLEMTPRPHPFVKSPRGYDEKDDDNGDDPAAGYIQSNLDDATEASDKYRFYPEEDEITIYSMGEGGKPHVSAASSRSHDGKTSPVGAELFTHLHRAVHPSDKKKEFTLGSAESHSDSR